MSDSIKTDWPEHIPKPSDDDLQFLAEMSDRETGSSFFDTKSKPRTTSVVKYR